MRRALRWIFTFHLPDTDDPYVRKQVVWTIIVLNFLMLFSLVVAVDYVVSARNTFHRGLRFERNFCHSQARARERANRKNGALHDWLLTHGASRETVAKIVVRQPALDCHTGMEISNPPPPR